MALSIAEYTNIGIGLAFLYTSFQQKREQQRQQVAREKSEAAIQAAKEAVELAAKKSLEAVEAQKAEAAQIAEKVKSELLKTTEVNDKKLDTIHNLVNSDMGKVLAKHAEDRDKIAILENTPENIAAAREAHVLLDNHQSKQHQVDVKQDTGFEPKPTQPTT